MGRAEGRLDGHDRELKEVKDAIQKLQEEKKVSPSDFEKLKADVSKLKEWRSYVLGAAAVVVLGISIGATIATKILFTSPSP